MRKQKRVGDERLQKKGLTQILEVPGGEKRDNEAEVRFEEIMTERFPKQVAKHVFHRHSEPQAR